jgi:diacylglycerol O-acyltransferase / wax synthase
MKAENNGFKNDKIAKAKTPFNKGRISRDIPVDLLKAKGKAMGGTLNDVLMTVISCSLKQHLARYKDDTTTKSIWLSVPFSLRPPPKSEMDFQFNNQVVVMPLEVRLVSDYKEGFKLIHGDMARIKESQIPFGILHLMNLTMLLPHSLRDYILGDLSDKMTFVFSNVPGPRKPFVLNGKASKGFAFFVPGLKSIMGGISIMSHCDTVKISLSMDPVVMKDPKELMDIIYENLDVALGTEWREFHHELDKK